MTTKIVSILAMLFMSLPLVGASVFVDGFKLSGGDGQYYLDWSNFQLSASVLFSSATKGNVTALNAHGSSATFMGCWASGVWGSLIDQYYFDNLETAFLNGQPWSAIPEEGISVTGNQNIYLVVVVNDYHYDPGSPYYYSPDNAYYGWVGVNVNQGNVSLLGSYLDLSGSGVYVGKCISVGIPEPSACVLILLGLAWVCMSRRNVPNVPR